MACSWACTASRPRCAEVVDRRAEPDRLHDRRGAGLELVRDRRRRSSAPCVTVSIISPPPRNGGSASSTVAPAPQHADAGGADDLVAGEGQRGRVAPRGHRGQVDRQLRRGLRGVDDDDRAHLVGPPGHLGDRVDGAEHVGHPGERDDLGALGEQLVDVREVEVAVVGQPEPAQRRAGALGEQLPRDDVGVVLHLGDDDLVARADLVRARPTPGCWRPG